MRKALLQSAALIAAVALVPTLTAGSAATDVETYRELDQFMSVFERIKANYVDKVDDKALLRGAMDGMLASLDAHSSYMDAREYRTLQQTTTGSYSGLGLTVAMEDGTVKVIAPMEGSPGDRAGIKPADYITHINGELLYGFALDEAVDKMKGPPGSSIRLTIVRAGRDKAFDVTLTREIVKIKSVEWKVKDGVGIVNVNAFDEQTGREVHSAIASINGATGGKPLGYVVDLRSNPGGLLTAAVDVSDAFLGHGEIVSQRGREKGDIERFFAQPGDDARGLPIVVLVDVGTASAAEIVAGALQDNRRALVLGERSFGKGSVQTVIPLSGDTAIRLTTARYYTPSGRSVQEGGIEPDIRVPQLSDPDYKSRPRLREADLRRHLLNQAKVDDRVLEEDQTPDPRYAATPDTLKKAGITDFQLDYAVRTIARLGTPAVRTALAAAPPVRRAR